MVLVSRVQKRGANIVVEAYGEVLFAATGPIGTWTRRFSNAVRTAAAAEAPINKRPRWGHYGKPLKSTFTASTTYQPGRMRVYSAIGSTSPHAYYVDQGTGVHAGNAPYEAKILPPWERGSPTLYEAAWSPGGPGHRKVAPVFIKGQRGQFFMAAGLKRGFEIMRMRSFNEPHSPEISEALNSFPEGLLNFAGNTRDTPAFRASLEEWRSWRNAALLVKREAQKAEAKARGEVKRAAAAVKRREAKHSGLNAKGEAALANAGKGPRSKKMNPAQKADRGKFLMAMQKKYGASNVETASLTQRNGYWYITVRVPMPNKPRKFEFKEVRAKAKS